MDGAWPLCRMLDDALAARDARATAGATLEAALEAALRAAADACPDLELAPDLFLPYLAARLPEGVPPETALAQIQVADLYVACGCLRGEPAAVRALDQRLEREIAAALAHIQASDVAQEVRQTVREKLLVGVGGEPPRIGDYSGRGSLRGWLRTVAVRAALDLLRKGKKELLGQDDRLAAIPSPGYDPEIEHLKQRYRAEFQEALLAALSALSDREKNVLRQHFLYELTIDQIGALYQVHRATAARWINQAQEKLFKETRRALTERLKITRPEVESILRLIHSRLDVSLRDILT